MPKVGGSQFEEHFLLESPICGCKVRRGPADPSRLPRHHWTYPATDAGQAKIAAPLQALGRSGEPRRGPRNSRIPIEQVVAHRDRAIRPGALSDASNLRGDRVGSVVAFGALRQEQNGAEEEAHGPDESAQVGEGQAFEAAVRLDS